MKEIKLKIYDKFNESICDVLEIDFKKKKVTALYRNFLPNIYDFDEVEFLQFVGLKDINDKDIYEKDLICNGIDCYEVIFDAQRACFLGKSESNINNLDDLLNNGYYIENNNLNNKNKASQ